MKNKTPSVVCKICGKVTTMYRAVILNRRPYWVCREGKCYRDNPGNGATR